ncbi:hypothetical protein KPH14_007446 [Odynerus spinipes]|uniref:Odorant receptor n=1 Tax=Odynerus spinipes TaxID=1348599 RepID=A0AAD9RB42_9HYME|nr:hypothetical protein KPH14_007446 [Odynerus spinipes]
MHILPVSFALFTYVGFWRPVDWPRNSLKYWLYNIYTVFMVFMLCLYGLCGIGDAYADQNVNTFIEKFTLTISVLAVCVKVINIIIRRESVISLVNMLLEKNCLPRDSEEKLIQQSFDDRARKITIYCEFLNEITVIIAIIMQQIQSAKTHTLDVWTPYDCSSSFAFWFTVIHQSVALLVCANSSVAHETLISCLMLQICAQLEILGHRIKHLPKMFEEVEKDSNFTENWKIQEKRIVRELIEYHLYIYSFASRVNSVFTTMIMLQFSISTIVLCLTVYRMSKSSIASIEFIWGLSYLASMFIQIFLYCWFGNEVMLKSTQVGDMFYEMDWVSLGHNFVVKLLPIVMSRATKPILMRSGYIILLSAESFTSILKTSYSAFNVLQNSS